MGWRFGQRYRLPAATVPLRCLVSRGQTDIVLYIRPRLSAPDIVILILRQPSDNRRLTTKRLPSTLKDSAPRRLAFGPGQCEARTVDCRGFVQGLLRFGFAWLRGGCFDSPRHAAGPTKERHAAPFVPAKHTDVVNGSFSSDPGRPTLTRGGHCWRRITGASLAMPHGPTLPPPPRAGGMGRRRFMLVLSAFFSSSLVWNLESGCVTGWSRRSSACTPTGWWRHDAILTIAAAQFSPRTLIQAPCGSCASPDPEPLFCVPRGGSDDDLVSSPRLVHPPWTQ